MKLEKGTDKLYFPLILNLSGLKDKPLHFNFVFIIEDQKPFHVVSKTFWGSII